MTHYDYSDSVPSHDQSLCQYTCRNSSYLKNVYKEGRFQWQRGVQSIQVPPTSLPTSAIPPIYTHQLSISSQQSAVISQHLAVNIYQSFRTYWSYSTCVQSHSLLEQSRTSLLIQSVDQLSSYIVSINHHSGHHHLKVFLCRRPQLYSSSGLDLDTQVYQIRHQLIIWITVGSTIIVSHHHHQCYHQCYCTFFGGPSSTLLRTISTRSTSVIYQYYLSLFVVWLVFGHTLTLSIVVHLIFQQLTRTHWT